LILIKRYKEKGDRGGKRENTGERVRQRERREREKLEKERESV